MANNTNTLCLTDKDCGEFKACFRNVPWSDEESFCECVTFYGFQGENCDEVGGTGEFLLAANLLILHLALIGLIAILIDSVVFRRYLSYKNTLFRNWFFSFFLLLFFLIYATLNIIAVSNPQDVILLPDGDRGSKYEIGIGPIILGIFFLSLLSLSTTTVIWLTVVYATQAIHSDGKKLQIRRLKLYVLALQIIAVVTVFICVILDQTATLLLIAALTLVVLCFFVYGRYQFLRFIKQVISNRPGGINANLGDFKNSTTRITVITVIALIIFVVYLSFSRQGGYRKFSEPDTLSAYAVLREIAVLSILIGALLIQQSLHSRLVHLRDAAEGMVGRVLEPQESFRTPIYEL